MSSFRLFLESEETKNVKEIISKLPKGHQELLKGYKFKFTGGNVLDGDNNHVGYIHKNKIVVAAPWSYSRSMTFLHEIAHLVDEFKMTPELKKDWASLLKKTMTKHKEYLKINKKSESLNALDQNPEEIFCMVYAATYSKHPPITYYNKDWVNFIKKKVPG